MENEYTDSEWSTIHEEFKRVKDTVYLDHAGSTLYSERQLGDVFSTLTQNIYCNPHTSKTTEDLIDQVRYRILANFNTTADAYSVVFTSGATASLRTVAESFRFGSRGSFVHLTDNHTSVLGMREVVGTDNVLSVRKDEFSDWVSDETPSDASSPTPDADDPSNSLFVYSAQCNFSGYKYPLNWIQQVHGKSSARNWYVLLDAASFAATNQLDLTKYPADFVCISFYKLFGYPTGLGALLVSLRGQEVLRKKYYGGGTVQIAMAQENWHVKRARFHERFEDGTIPFLSIISLLSGYDTLERLVPPVEGRPTMERISRHCYGLARYLWRKLALLRHSNGRHVVRFYSDSKFEGRHAQGGIVNLNVLDEDDSVIGFSEILAVASIFNVHLRTGCFCNPGACQRHLGLTNEEVRSHFQAGHICGDLVDLVDGVPTGSVRISVGYMTSQENVDRVVDMIGSTFIRKTLQTNRCMHDRMLTKTHANPQPIRLKQICVFPVKSCAPFKVTTRWPLTERGLKYDREWMIVNSNGVCLTQKSNTRLCLVCPVVDTVTNRMWLSFPSAETKVSVPLQADEQNRNILASLCQSKVCGDRIQGIDCGNEVAEWLSEVLCETDLRLIRQSSTDTRTFKDRRQKDTALHAQSISLANTAQFLLINRTSVDWLAQKVDDWGSAGENLDVTVDRFRGNLIIETPTALEENNWTRIRFGSAEFDIQGPCTRCQMICIDQNTGEKTTEPLRTISREFQGKVRFGIYMGRSVQKPTAGPPGRAEYIECGKDVHVD